MAERPKKTTMSVREMREMLGLGKTDSYWLLKKKFFDVVLVNGKMRVVIESFENWYANQVKYSKVNGPPPGEKLNERSYSIVALAEMLGVSDTTIYDLIKKGCFQAELVDYWTRVPKQSFDQWYASQSRYRTAADREKDREIEEATISMPEMASLLGIHRNKVYSIIYSHPDEFEVVIVADRKRITKKSFQKWLLSRKKSQTVQPAETLLHESVKPEVPVKKAPPAEDPPLEIRLDKASYSVKEAALLMDLPQRVIYRMVQSGELKALSINRQVRILREDLFMRVYDIKGQTEPGGGN